MDALEHYVTDCENKRRRMRHRPSDAVVTELRSLLDFWRAAREHELSPGGKDRDPAVGREGPERD